MNRTVLIFLFTFVALPIFAHEFYFSFSELEYNDFTKRFELTITATTHDLELALEKNHSEIKDIFNLSEDELGAISTYTNNHFKLKTGGSTCEFTLIGIESKLDGTSNLYWESTETEIGDDVEITYDFLMETFQEQQNKVTLYVRSNTYTASFTRTSQIQTIKLENQEE